MKQGGKLAATMSPSLRMEMIQRGYHPGNPEDVKRFQAGQKATGDILQVAIKPTEPGQNMMSMGEKNMSYNGDYAAIRTQAGEGGFEADMERINNFTDEGGNQVFNQSYNEDGFIDEDGMGTPGKSNYNFDALEAGRTQNPTVNSVKDRMGDYGAKNNGVTNLDQAVGKILAKRTTIAGPQQQERVLGPNATATTAGYNNQRTITVPRKATVITESKQAAQAGYTNGIKYLNSFVKLLKNPTIENRIQLITMLNEMVIAEDGVHPKLLSEYRKGVTLAEQKMYQQIKQTKKNV